MADDPTPNELAPEGGPGDASAETEPDHSSRNLVILFLLTLGLLVLLSATGAASAFAALLAGPQGCGGG